MRQNFLVACFTILLLLMNYKRHSRYSIMFLYLLFLFLVTIYCILFADFIENECNKGQYSLHAIDMLLN